MANKVEKVVDQAVEAVEAVFVAKPTFWEKWHTVIIAAGTFVLGAAAEAAWSGYRQGKQLNLTASNDPMVEIPESID